jgi:predicted small secreted protein
MKLNISIGLKSLLLFFVMNNFAIAGDDYLCTIERLSFAEGDSGDVYESHKSRYIGEKFTVERYSGIMAGRLNNSYVNKPQIIDYGSNENAYKVVTTMKLNEGAGSGSYIITLIVNEYEEKPKKSFVYLINDYVYFGHCEHF